MHACYKDEKVARQVKCPYNKDAYVIDRLHWIPYPLKYKPGSQLFKTIITGVIDFLDLKILPPVTGKYKTKIHHHQQCHHQSYR